MSQQYVIDCQRFARDCQSLQGLLPVSRLSRLCDLLAESGGEVRFELLGGVRRQGRPFLQLEVDGSVLLRCQRCLDAYTHPVRISSTLDLIGSEAELSQAEFEDDSRDFLTSEREFDVVALVEDEIILSLPIVPRHEQCALPCDGAGERGESPFAALATLKGRAASSE